MNKNPPLKIPLTPFYKGGTPDRGIIGENQQSLNKITQMPVIKTKTIRTMREIWDEERKLKRKRDIFSFSQQSRSGDCLGAEQEKQLVKIRKYYLEHLELKKVALDFFPEYEKYLGEAGFLKI